MFKHIFKRTTASKAHFMTSTTTVLVPINHNNNRFPHLFLDLFGFFLCLYVAFTIYLIFETTTDIIAKTNNFLVDETLSPLMLTNHAFYLQYPQKPQSFLFIHKWILYAIQLTSSKTVNVLVQSVSSKLLQQLTKFTLSMEHEVSLCFSQQHNIASTTFEKTLSRMKNFATLANVTGMKGTMTCSIKQLRNAAAFYAQTTLRAIEQYESLTTNDLAKIESYSNQVYNNTQYLSLYLFARLGLQIPHFLKGHSAKQNIMPKSIEPSS
jgi:hypothetical protein